MCAFYYKKIIGQQSFLESVKSPWMTESRLVVAWDWGYVGIGSGCKWT